MANDGVDKGRRCFLTAATTVVGGVGAAAAAVPFVQSLQPSARTKAIGAPVEADVSRLKPGERMIAKWRGQPVWILRRSEEALASIGALNDQVRDPGSAESEQPQYAINENRSIKPEYLVVVGLCTHLGCSPLYVPADAQHDLGADWKGGFHCPCHGSKFDLAGRVYKGVPAPTNLTVPPHEFVSETRLIIGADKEHPA